MPFLGKTPSQIVDPEVDIDGGTIDGVSIGSVTANAGAFTNLTATGTLTLPDDGISGDDVNGGTISNFASTGIDDNATSTAITIDSSQRVGIGVTPASIFNAGGALVVDNTTGGTVPFVKAFRATTGNNRPIFQTESNVGVTATFAGDGNVGVGTSSPTTPMHIQNSAVSPSWSAYAGTTLTLEDASNQGTILQFVSPSSYTTEVWFGDADSRNSGRIRYEHSVDKMEFWTSGTERFSVESDGALHAKSSNTGTNPAANAHIASELRFFNTSATDNNLNAIGFYNSNELIDARIAAVHKSHSSRQGELVFMTHSGSELGERARIDSSGNVSIGTSSTANALFKTDIKGSSTGNFQALRLFNSSDGASATTDLSFCLNRVGSEVLGVAGSIKAGKEQTWTTTPSTVDGYLSFSTVLDETPAERMRIDSSGNVLVARTATGNSATDYGFNIYNTGQIYVYSTSAGTDDVWRAYSQGTVTSAIDGNGTYQNLSDSKYKDNIAPTSVGLSEIQALNVVSFDWNTSGDHVIAGYVAQELMTVLPNLVSADDETGDLRVNHMGIIPVLTKAIQEQQAIIEDLQTRLSALEAN